LRPLFEPILWFQKPYKTGGTLADNVLEYGVGAWNENALSTYCAYNSFLGNIEVSNILSVPYDKNDRGLHETQKPLKLMECLVALVTREDAIVIDPFAGSGTTCLAAKNLNRHYVGVEINEDFAAIARNRLLESKYQISLDLLLGFRQKTTRQKSQF
jgi:site-specific DNA-methyltransferase (adenine-specific)